MPTLPHGLLVLGSELVALAIVLGVIARGLYAGPENVARRRTATVAVLTVAVLGAAVYNLRGTGQELHSSYIQGTSQRAGLNRCLNESVPSHAAFVRWLRPRMPANARYALELGVPQDPWCVTLTLLPRLPVFGTEPPQYVIAFGVLTPGLRRRIARHDRNVEVFAPGYALERVPS